MDAVIFLYSHKQLGTAEHVRYASVRFKYSLKHGKQVTIYDKYAHYIVKVHALSWRHILFWSFLTNRPSIRQTACEVIRCYIISTLPLIGPLAV